MHQQQTQLPFAVADATCAERKILLWFAVQQARVDLRVATLCQWVFERTAGGFDGQTVTISCDQLATMPWGLCCSISTARRTVKEAKRAGLLILECVRDSAGRQTSNSLGINWSQIRHILGVAANHPRMGGQLDSPGYQLDSPGYQLDSPPSQLDSPPCQVEQQLEQQTGGDDRSRPSPLIPAGETPRTHACAPSFVRSSFTSTYEGTNGKQTACQESRPGSEEIAWEQIVPLARKVTQLVWPGRQSNLKPEQRWTIARVVYLGLSVYGEDWLLNGIRHAARRKPRDLDYVKGTLANTSGDRAAFFARFDALRQDAGWYRSEKAKADDG